MEVLEIQVSDRCIHVDSLITPTETFFFLTDEFMEKIYLYNVCCVSCYYFVFLLVPEAPWDSRVL